ncbi:MalY/PatB family protein [Algicella marina]|uniref:cysteine-S-conjugate beta-lyase n=1 Tax=Algicella marina TaxID=2683284 RepID=A0A6P1T8V8_9RHOB|nr:MalY/PatB family protein [Algicella marina]QHQ37062.1 putative C-S lyase [Algicella marina]
MDFDFDEPIDRLNTNCVKWDMLDKIYGVSPKDGIAMWVADMDFKAPPAVNATLQKMVSHGVHGYFGDDRAYKQSIISWMEKRHDWRVDPKWISTVHGLVAGTALCIQTYSEPGDSVILFTPVYHAFSRMVAANDREIVESELELRDGRYHMDLEALEGQLTGRERLVIFCSPHNPSGRVWSVEELKQLADFCARHDLILVSDEVHHDLVFPHASHTPMVNAAHKHLDRIVMLTAASKSFNLAGGMTGNAIIPDDDLRARFAKVHASVGTSPNKFGVMMTTAAYAFGEAWLEALVTYLDGNRQLMDEGLNAIPGVRSIPMDSTYLAWVDFSGTGMEAEEFTRRVEGTARVVGNHGPTFGKGGENFLRFNFATQRSRVEEAVARIQDAFRDLQ